MDKLKYVLFLFLIFILSFSLVDGKSYSLNKANIEMYILDNGSINVSEEITFNFDGDFTFAYRDIPKGYWNISNISVYEGNNNIKTEILNESNNIRIKWYFNAYNESKTFTIKYNLTNAITKYQDISELNWKIWGSEWDHSLKEIFATIYLPSNVSDPKEVYTFGHPALKNSKIGMINNNKIILQAFNINANQFVELRLLFPNYLLTSNNYANIKNELGLQKIIDEEKNYGKINWLLFFIICIIYGLSIFFIWFYLCKSEKVDFQDVYLRDTPYNYSPGVASYVITMGFPTNSISAEVLNLCLKKKMQIEKILKKNLWGKDDYKFIIINSSNTNLSSSEKYIFDTIKTAANYSYKNYLLFKKEVKDNTPNEILLSEFKEYLKKNESGTTTNFYISWCECIREDAKKEGFKINFLGVILIFILSMLFLIFNIFILKLYFFIILIFFMSLIFISIRPKLMKPNKILKLHHLKWGALKKYLKDFSDFNNKEVMDIKLWEKYLVYAIPLDVAKKVQKDMKLVFANYNGNIKSNIFVGFSITNISDFVNISNDFNTAFSSAMATSGSSGFSGGGGSGGGGGGGGAG